MKHLLIFVEALKREDNLDIQFTDTKAYLGFFVKDTNKIRLNESLMCKTELNSFKRLSVLIHEYAHYNLHYSVKNDKNRVIKEYEAELTAYLVMKKIGVENPIGSFKYISNYSKDMITKILEENNKNAIDIISNVSKTSNKIYEKICPNITYKKDMNIEKEQNNLLQETIKEKMDISFKL